jgi:hypothetical protein
MNPTPRSSLREAINAKCRDCIFDPFSRGKWREQVAACPSANCSLFDVRPVPRDCTVGGCMDPLKIATIRDRLSAPVRPSPVTA